MGLLGRRRGTRSQRVGQTAKRRWLRCRRRSAGLRRRWCRQITNRTNHRAARGGITRRASSCRCRRPDRWLARWRRCAGRLLGDDLADRRQDVFHARLAGRNRSDHCPPSSRGTRPSNAAAARRVAAHPISSYNALGRPSMRLHSSSSGDCTLKCRKWSVAWQRRNHRAGTVLSPELQDDVPGDRELSEWTVPPSRALLAKPAENGFRAAVPRAPQRGYLYDPRCSRGVASRYSIWPSSWVIERPHHFRRTSS